MVWSDALGTPSTTPPNLDADLPRDWARSWCWSLVLPDNILVDWRDQIAQVTARYGAPRPEELERRFDTSEFGWGSSAHSVEELSRLAVLDAARLVARWRPDAESKQRLQSARELARALQAVVEADPITWSQDPQAVVTTLHEPVYILHYFDALTTKASDVTEHTDDIIAAATLARTEQWTPVVLGSDDFDFEPDWRRVNTATVNLIAALATHDGLHDAHLDIAWEWALALTDRAPNDNDRSFNGHDALTRAINNDRGPGLQALFALAWWEYRRHNAVRDTFTEVLDEIVQIRGDIGMEFRAILAQRRVLLETMARDWLDANIAVLFRHKELGAETFSLTLKYAGRATPWFYSNLRDDLYAAAQNNTDHAIAWLLIGALHHEPGYELDTIITSLRRNPDALTTAAGEIAELVQNSKPGSAQLRTAVTFWTKLLNSERNKVPTSTLPPAGRWAFVNGLDDTTWAQLTAQTLDITDGSVAFAIEVADRCRTAAIPTYNTLILLRLLGHGEPWEQHYVARAAIDALRAISATRLDAHFDPLRTRLIELGYYEATDIEAFRGEGLSG
jgi:hypothetical protein